MHLDVLISASIPPRPIHRARAQSVRIQRQLAIAGAELELTNAVLDHNLPASVRTGEVKRALTHNEAIEGQVQEAADELRAVTELLAEEVAERERLELELAKRPAS